MYINIFKNIYLTFKIKFYLRNFKIINIQFIKKYIHITKTLKPNLTKKTTEYITKKYAKLRNQNNIQNNNITKIINLYFITIPYQSNSIYTYILNLNIKKLINLRYLFINPLIPEIFSNNINKFNHNSTSFYL